jgi:hypothetical protein
VTESVEARDGPRPSAIIRRAGSRRFLSTDQSAEKLHHAAPIEVQDDLVVLQALTSFHRTKVPQQAVMTIAHSSQSAILEPR